MPSTIYALANDLVIWVPMDRVTFIRIVGRTIA